MTTATVLTIHDNASSSIDDLVKKLVDKGFRIVSASPDQLMTTAGACLFVDTIIVDYPQSMLEEVVETSYHCFGDVPIIWLHPEVPEDQTLEIAGQHIVCIKAPIAAETFATIVGVLTRSADSQRELTRTSMSLEQLKSTITAGVHHGHTTHKIGR